MLGAGYQLLRAQRLTSGPPAGSGEGRAGGPQLPTASTGMAGGKEGLLQPPKAPSLARDRRRPQTQRSPHPAFRIPNVCLLGPSASLGASQASLCPGGQGARMRLLGTHACPASPPQGLGPQCLLTVCGSVAASGGCVPRPSLLRGAALWLHSHSCPGVHRGWAPALPAFKAPQGQALPFHRLTSSSGGGRGCGDWRAPGPPDLCPLPRWRPRSLRTWWSTTRAPGTPACWPQTASCPSCSASLTAASTAWPSLQVPSRGLSPLLAAGRGRGQGWARPKGHVPDRPLLSSLSPGPSVCWGSGDPVEAKLGSSEFSGTPPTPSPGPPHFRSHLQRGPRPTTSR